jgi:dsRNA-specific ribonuclease
MIGSGTGHSKKDAQQAAAKDAIISLGVKNE